MFRSFWIFVIAAMCGLFAASAEAAPGKPLSDADRAEVASLNDLAVSVMDDMNTSMNLVSSDQPRSCELIRKAEQKSLQLQNRVTTLQNKLVAEGKTTEGVEQMVAGSAKMVSGSHDAAQGICGGAFNNTGDPQTDAILQKLARLMAAFTNALSASVNAEQNNDHPAACLHMRETGKAYAELYDYMVELRSKIPDGSPDAAQFDAAIAKIAPFKEQLRTSLANCPAV